MNKLPQEMIDQIVSYLPQLDRVGCRSSFPPPLAPLATVSYKFQKAVERRTFRSIYIDATDVEIDEFESILSPWRRPNLQVLEINVMVPSCRLEGLKSYRQLDVEAATTPLRRLWRFLSSAWTEVDIETGNFLLSLRTVTENEEPEEFYACPPLSFTPDAESFTALPFVRTFMVKPGFCHWDPRVLVVLASAMPNLEVVFWPLDKASHQWDRYYSVDKEFRSGLVQAIQTSPLPFSTRFFQFHLKRPSLTMPTHILPKFIADGEIDDVSCAIRKFTSHCEQIKLSGSFGLSLFDPPMEEQPCWQNTTRLRVLMTLDLPDGSCLFEVPGNHVNLAQRDFSYDQLPPGYGDTGQELESALRYFMVHKNNLLGSRSVDGRSPIVHHISIHPNEQKLNALFAAFARCCVRMPVLTLAELLIWTGEQDVWSISKQRRWRFPLQVLCIDPLNNADICAIYHSTKPGHDNYIDVSPNAPIPLSRSAVAVLMPGALPIDVLLYDYDEFSPDGEIVKGEASFKPGVGKSEAQSIKGIYGEISIRVTWS
ncbi:hypothetical protein F4859DRAFT_514571 [Xylaria cf. heliscus]|nr:hypothetical protein F4859DRAFT_514571 [Xylaria cf. heliscus]